MSKQIEAALAMIKPGMTVSLGGGSHVASLADAMRAANFAGTVISPSELTRAYCRQIGLQVSDELRACDLAFDGCDGIDAEFNLLKSNGGIFVDERAYAEHASQYVIMAPLAKYGETFNADVPLTVAVKPKRAAAVLASIEGQGLGAELRVAVNYMGYVRTNHGDLLIDVHSSDWRNIAGVDKQLRALTGVVDTSYLRAAADVLIAEEEDGQVQILRKGAQHD